MCYWLVFHFFMKTEIIKVFRLISKIVGRAWSYAGKNLTGNEVGSSSMTHTQIIVTKKSSLQDQKSLSQSQNHADLLSLYHRNYPLWITSSRTNSEPNLIQISGFWTGTMHFYSRKKHQCWNICHTWRVPKWLIHVPETENLLLKVLILNYVKTLIALFPGMTDTAVHAQS
jgi:hypothetical protein